MESLCSSRFFGNLAGGYQSLTNVLVGDVQSDPQAGDSSYPLFNYFDGHNVDAFGVLPDDDERDQG